jgi:hypothetical protein
MTHLLKKKKKKKKKKIAQKKKKKKKKLPILQIDSQGLFLAWYIHKHTENTKLAIGVFWFFLMEFLQVRATNKEHRVSTGSPPIVLCAQGFQYFFINDCDSFWNKFLTFLGFVHICYQVCLAD